MKYPVQVGLSAQLSSKAINPTSPILLEHQTIGEWSSIVYSKELVKFYSFHH